MPFTHAKPNTNIILDVDRLFVITIKSQCSAFSVFTIPLYYYTYDYCLRDYVNKHKTSTPCKHCHSLNFCQLAAIT